MAQLRWPRPLHVRSIADTLNGPDPDRFDLRDVDLRKADLAGVHLEGADLGGAHLEEAHLGGAHLERVWLHRAHLEDASLHGAHLERAVAGATTVWPVGFGWRDAGVIGIAQWDEAIRAADEATVAAAAGERVDVPTAEPPDSEGHPSEVRNCSDGDGKLGSDSHRG
ncbi:MAG TPA: pentapeptide repeat-containing protein [Actinomycetes bacterium]|nr:pentapeptide repeat-containing protein [Actinomycetes bacterium]